MEEIIKADPRSFVIRLRLGENAEEDKLDLCPIIAWHISLIKGAFPIAVIPINPEDFWGVKHPLGSVELKNGRFYENYILAEKEILSTMRSALLAKREETKKEEIIANDLDHILKDIDYKKECLGCHEVFCAERDWQKFCSADCRVAFAKAKNRLARRIATAQLNGARG